MPCIGKKTFETARDTGSFLIAHVKANQRGLHETLEAISAAVKPTDSADPGDDNRHGRPEHRVIDSFDVSGRRGAEWNGRIVTAARVTRLTWRPRPASGIRPLRRPSMRLRSARPQPQSLLQSASIGASKPAPITAATLPSSKITAGFVPTRAT